MSVSRKLFLAIASFILAMGIVFVFLTQVVVSDIFQAKLNVDRSKEIKALSSRFAAYYEQNGGVWDGVEKLSIGSQLWDHYPDAGFVLRSGDQQLLYKAGEASAEHMTGLGIRSRVQSKGETVGFLYYYDREAADIATLRLGIKSSVAFLLIAGAVVFVLISLVVAYWLSKRLTAPLRMLIPAIQRFGNGEFGIQADVSTNDEYGTVAEAFNKMSLQVQRAEEARKQLVADVSHELRTPLTILRGKLELIQQSGRSAGPESLLPLQDELIRLSRLVDELHQLSLAEAKQLRLDKKPVDIAALLQRIIEHVSPDAESKRIAVRLHDGDGIPKAEADPNRITQVFLNLLVNAVRYTPPGGVVDITVGEETAHDGERRFLRIEIADTGQGIKPEHLPFLFNRFYRTDEARTRNSGGMGLGLAIAKEFVVAHDGSIDVESVPGQGTTFVVKLPLQLLLPSAEVHPCAEP